MHCALCGGHPSLLCRSGGRQPLFYQPGKSGFYAPCCATPTPERLNAYRNVGRVIGLCLLNCETIPLPLCRHVLKYLLNKPVSLNPFTWIGVSAFVFVIRCHGMTWHSLIL